MKRNDFLFKNSSRIYKQANSLALSLRRRFKKNGEWFTDVAELLAKHGLTSLQSDEQWLRAIEYAKQHADSIACQIDPRIAIAALLEATDDFYYRDPSWKEDVPICGSALKTSIALIWPNRRAQNAIDKSSSKLQELVLATMAWEQLSGSYEQYKVFKFDSAEFSSSGFTYSSERDQWLRFQWNEMASPYGATQRTLEHSKSVIFKDLNVFSEEVSNVLNGKKSSTVKLFAGTVFALAGEEPTFWLGLKARLTLLLFAIQFKRAGSDDFSGVVLFESFPAIFSGFGPHPAAAQESVMACFWQPNWYTGRVRNHLSNMLVERPVVRIDERTFATSVMTIIDSINCFVENSIFCCLDYGGAPVNAKAFQVCISQPFEQAAVELFRDKGWKASGVSSAGNWPAGSCQLIQLNGKPVPGEIDVLALHPSGLFALVIECKVLTQPFTMSKLTNVVGKLGADDQEGFHSNLEKKVNWLADVPTLQGAEIMGALLVDKGSFLGEGAPNPVIDLERLDELLDQVNKDIASWQRETEIDTIN